MSVALVVALVALGILGLILIALAVNRPSEPDAVTREVIEQGLTGPVQLPPARHTRIQDPNRQEDGGNETP